MCRMASHQEGKTGDGCDRGTKRASVRAARPSAVRSRRRRVTRRPGGMAIQNKALPAPTEVRRAVARALQQPVSYPASGAMADRACQARPEEGVRPVRLSPVTLTSRWWAFPARSETLATGSGTLVLRRVLRGCAGRVPHLGEGAARRSLRCSHRVVASATVPPRSWTVLRGAGARTGVVRHPRHRSIQWQQHPTGTPSLQPEKFPIAIWKLCARVIARR